MYDNCKISKVRILGSIAAFDFNEINAKYGSHDGEKLKAIFLNNGLLLRPIGNTIYLMPPFCIKKSTKSQYFENQEILEILFNHMNKVGSRIRIHCFQS